jgi:hypothetical protein
MLGRGPDLQTERRGWVAAVFPRAESLGTKPDCEGGSRELSESEESG